MHIYIHNYIHTYIRTYVHTYIHSTPVNFTRVLKNYLDSAVCDRVWEGFSWPPLYFFLWGHLEAEEDLLVRILAMSAQYEYKVRQNTACRCNACSELRTALVHKLKIIILEILRAKYNEQTFKKTKQRTVKSP